MATTTTSTNRPTAASAATTTVELDALLQERTDAWRLAVARAAATYPAIEVPELDPAELTLTPGEAPIDVLVEVLRAAAGTEAPPESVDRGLAERIYREHYLGAGLFEACTGQERRWATGEPLIDREQLFAPRELLGPAGATLVTGRPLDETLYTLARLGISDAFGAVRSRRQGA